MTKTSPPGLSTSQPSIEAILKIEEDRLRDVEGLRMGDVAMMFTRLRAALVAAPAIKEATAAQHFDLPKGEPARFVRNGVLETCQCRDCVALAATPAVGGEREALAEAGLRHAEGLTAQLDRPDWKPSRAHIEQARNSIKKLADLALTAQPASPLRGRDTLIKRAAEFIRTNDPFGDYFSEYDLHVLHSEMSLLDGERE